MNALLIRHYQARLSMTKSKPVLCFPTDTYSRYLGQVLKVGINSC